jgi:dTDP-4-dehydrorhamnose reductase
VLGPGVLAAASARHALRLVTFSSDQVFDGRLRGPYVESDLPAPLNVFGHCQAEAERNVRATHPAALVVRSSALFGPWDAGDFVARALAALGAGEAFVAAADLVISPTYVPDLVHACLDLLIDGEAGIWHLTNCEPLTWAELARRACAHAGVAITHLDARPFAQLGRAARRPVCSPLYSEKEILLPPLEDALARCARHRRHPEEQGWAGQAADYSR